MFTQSTQTTNLCPEAVISKHVNHT